MDFMDFLLDDDGDLLIEDGDFAVGVSTDQEIEDIMASAPGWWKQYPLLGVNINSYAGSPGMDQQLQRLAELQLKSDGLQLITLTASLNISTNELDFNCVAIRP